MASKKKMNISVNPEEVMYSQISKSKDGYNSARMVVKSGEKEYMSISYEWEGEGVPDFVMNMMGFMQANQLELSAEKMCKKCKQPMSKCMCNDGGEPMPHSSDDQVENME
jgi:hypothetical protein